MSSRTTTTAKEIIWDGMGLVDKAFIPHADIPDPIYIERLPKFMEQYADHMDDLIVLNDNEAYVVDGDSQRKISVPYKPGTHIADIKLTEGSNKWGYCFLAIVLRKVFGT